MGLFNRSKRRRQKAVTAAGRRIDIGSQLEQELFRRQNQQGQLAWQNQAWLYYDELPEIRFGARFVGNSLSKVRIFSAFQPDPSEPPLPMADAVDQELVSPEDAATAEQTWQRVRSRFGGQSEIMRDYAINNFITGECYLIGLHPREATKDRPATPEDWGIFSVDELTSEGGTGFKLRTMPEESGSNLLELDPGDPADPNAPRDIVVRLWQPHPRFGLDSDSALRSVLTVCEELLILTQSILASATSRLNAGVWLLPDSILDGITDVTHDGQDGESTEDSVLDTLTEYFSTAVQKPASAARQVPFLLTMPVEEIAAAKDGLINFSRDIDTVAASQRIELINRLANGIDLPAEIVLGLSDANFWTAWQIAEDTFRYYLEPPAIQFVDGVNLGYYRPALEAAGVKNVMEHTLWIDASPLTTKPNQGVDATTGFEIGEVSGAFWRQAHGIPDTAEPTDRERAARILAERGEVIISGEGREALASPPPDEPPSPEDTEQGPPPEPVAEIVAAVTRPSNLGGQLAGIDRALVQRIVGAADILVTKVLERMGARLRSRVGAGSNRDAINQVDNALVAATLGPAIVEALLAQGAADPIAEQLPGQFSTLETQFLNWTRQAQDQALRDIEAQVDIDQAALADLASQQAQDRDAGWAVLLAGLVAITSERLFNPAPAAPPQGEFDPTLNVQASLVRGALARAGGATGAVLDSGAILEGAQEIPTGGLAAGRLLLGVLLASGAITTGLRWNWNGSQIAFEPHRGLNGAVFDSMSSSTLVNISGWPHFAFYFPQDHRGCQCDVEPIIQVPT